MEQKDLPNGTAVLVLGIVSIVLSFCYGLFGIICGIIAIVLSNKDLKLYNTNPELYRGIQNLRAGRTCGIIGLCIGSLFFVFVIIYIIFIGAFLLPLAAGA
jgi:hypothetical protein